MRPELRLETERLVLRPYREEDAAEVYRVFSDPEVFRYTPDTVYASIETARAFIREAMWLAATFDPPSTFRHFLAVLRRADGRYLGMAGVGGVEYDRTQNEIFYILAREAWGQGYATEAAREVLRYAFRDLGIPRVIGIVQAANVASARVLEKVGLRRAGTVSGLSPEFRYHEGELRYALDRHEYLAGGAA